MILSPTGGLVYHLRAWQNRSTWESTRQQVTEAACAWLRELQTPAQQFEAPFTRRVGRMAIFGPSAGYLLEFAKFFTLVDRFGEVRIVEPDPIARVIWRRRWQKLPATIHRRVALSFDTRTDRLPWWSSKPDDFAHWLENEQIDTVLFFGLLGQIELLAPSFVRPTAMARQLLQEALCDRPWASLHDLWSWPSTQVQIDHDTHWLNAALEVEHQAAIDWQLTPYLRHELSFRSHRILSN
jgi:hypothetical protein